MPKVAIVDITGKQVGEYELSENTFGQPVNEYVLHEVVRAHLANCRQGTQSALTRAEVSGGGIKPWRQKGTGRARAGMSSSPLWRGGGRIFPNSPDENFSHKLNKKMYRAGMASILSQLVREDRLAIVDSIAVEAPKTKLFAQKIKAMGYDSVLVITGNLDENVYLASRNLPNVLVLEVSETDPVSLIRFPKVLMTKCALAKFEEILG